MIRPLIALLLLAPPPFTDDTLALVARQPGFKAPAQGIEAIAEFHRQNGNLADALRLYRFALVHQPGNSTVAGRIRELERALAPPASAPASPAPASPASAAPSPEPATSAAPESPASPSPATSVTSLGPTTGTSAASDAMILEKIAAILDIPPDPAFLDAAQREAAPGLVREKKLQALNILKTLDAAVRFLLAKEPKRELPSINLDLLRSVGAVPDDFAVPAGFVATFAEGVPSLEGFPPLADLEGELADYRNALAIASRLVGNDLRGQAVETIGQMLGSFTDDPVLLARLIDLQLELGLDAQGLDAARALARLKPLDPGVLHSLDLFLYRNGEDARARDLARLVEERWPGTFHAVLARAVRDLVENPIDPKLLEVTPLPASPRPSPR